VAALPWLLAIAFTIDFGLSLFRANLVHSSPPRSQFADRYRRYEQKLACLTAWLWVGFKAKQQVKLGENYT